jgi:hypothetical protein
MKETTLLEKVEAKAKSEFSNIVEKYERVGVLGNKSFLDTPVIQQGDCLIKKCGTEGVFVDEFTSIPSDAKKVEGNLVLKGSTNSHALYGGKFQLYKSGERLFLKVDETTVLDHVKDLQSKSHAEHHAQYVPPGEYFVDELLEYDHLLEESRRVID